MHERAVLVQQRPSAAAGSPALSGATARAAVPQATSVYDAHRVVRLTSGVRRAATTYNRQHDTWCTACRCADRSRLWQAYENFYYTSKFLGIKDSITVPPPPPPHPPSPLTPHPPPPYPHWFRTMTGTRCQVDELARAVEAFCKRPWAEVAAASQGEDVQVGPHTGAPPRV